MALVNIINMTVLDNPTTFTNPFQFEITFECIQELRDDLEWKVIYVGNAENDQHDQVLEEVMVGPVPTGIQRFVLQAPPPDPALINNNDLLGVTVVLVSCWYMDHKFVQIGYYVNNEYSEEYDPEHPPNPIEVSKLFRNILSDQPRVTRYPIDWTGEINPINDPGTSPEEADDDQDEVLDFTDGTLDVLGAEEDEDDEDDDDDEEGEDLNAEVDLEEEEEVVVAAGGEEEVSGSDDGQENYMNGSMQMMDEDSNSMDIERMLQQ